MEIEKPLNKETNPEILKITEQYEKEIYDLKQILEIFKLLSSTIEFSKLIESIIYTCMGQFHVLGASVFVLEALDSTSFVLNKHHNGISLDRKISYEIPKTHPVISVLEKNEEVYTVDELKSILPENTNIDMISSLSPSLIVPLIQKNKLNGILLLGDRISMGSDDMKYSDYEKTQILFVASSASVAINNAILLDRSSTDMMTHLKLKYFFFNALNDKVISARKTKTPFSVLMCDIDFFKRFNDTYGHACGDYVLQTVARIIRSCIREKDLASRYGGEEFTVLLDDVDKENALIIAEHIRRKIEQFDFCFEEQHVKAMISVGVTEFNAETNDVEANPLVEQADKALYVSKRQGRNRVTFAEPSIIAEVSIPK